jgi:acylphosphatase
VANNDLTRLHVTIEGRVQGVNFRYFVTQKAYGLGVTGWVRNCYDGSVEVLAEGQRSKLENLISALRQGPPSAVVTGVKHEWQTVTGEFSDFQVRPTV